MERELAKKLKHGWFFAVPDPRSKNMSAINGKGNKTTEQRLRFGLVRAGIRGWKLRAGTLPGRPDFFFVREHSRFSLMAVFGMLAQVVVACRQQILYFGKRNSVEIENATKKLPEN